MTLARAVLADHRRRTRDSAADTAARALLPLPFNDLRVVAPLVRTARTRATPLLLLQLVLRVLLVKGDLVAPSAALRSSSVFRIATPSRSGWPESALARILVVGYFVKRSLLQHRDVVAAAEMCRLRLAALVRILGATSTVAVLSACFCRHSLRLLSCSAVLLSALLSASLRVAYYDCVP